MRKSVALLLSLVALSGGGCAVMDGAPPRPRLVVLIAVDGLPQRQVVENREQLAPDGFRRFLDRGAWFSEAYYGHSVTETAPGHSVMLTGAYPHRTGIIANTWRDRTTGKLVYNTGDPASTYLVAKTGALEGTSPRNLKAETVGDVLRGLDQRSKVIALSGKDRGAILTGGHKGSAYVYRKATGHFSSTTYYMKEHPAWVAEFNGRNPADAYFQGPDKPGPAFYDRLIATPSMDELTLAFARAAIAGESLGQDDAPDILAVSLSTHDYVNHANGAESPVSRDHVLQLDRALERFFKDLDAMVGRDRYLLVLTADHGFTPLPEYSQSLGRDAGRVGSSQLIAKVNGGLAAKFGGAPWIIGMSASALVLNRGVVAERKADAAAIMAEAKRLLLEEKMVAAAYTRAEIEGGVVKGPFLEQIRRGWDPERSGDVAVVLKPYWIFGTTAGRATHGSPHAYDAQVPILFYGPPWVRPGRVDARVEVADIAPTISSVLAIPAPSSSEGHVLPLGVTAR
jgi:hypothetical protein